MVVWCALATAVLVASTHAFTPSVVRRTNPQGSLACPSVEGLAIGSSGVARRPSNHQLQHMQEGLWARRRSGARARLSPAETGVPEVAARSDVAAALDHAVTEGGGGSPPSSKKLTERGGLLLLATVPLVWGTYGPSVKLLYQMGESPPGLLFNFACYAVSVMTFAAVAGFSKVKGKRPGESCVYRSNYIYIVLYMYRSCTVLISLAAFGELFSWSAGRSSVLVQPSTPPEERLPHRSFTRRAVQHDASPYSHCQGVQCIAEWGASLVDARQPGVET